MDFLERFRQYSKVQNVPNDAAPILLAISGGVDSMVMLHCFQASGLNYGIAHCNFQLRGAESDGDEIFVQETASKLGVPFFTKRFDTKTYATENGISTQMAARDLRYPWFAEIAAANNYQQLATAHNLNDSIETALLNFIRGTGLQGLIGMRNFGMRSADFGVRNFGMRNTGMRSAEFGIRNFGMRSAEFGIRNTEVQHDDLGEQKSPPSALHSALQTPHSALQTPHSALQTPHSAFQTPHSALQNPHSALQTPHSAFQNSALRIPHSALQNSALVRPLLFAVRDEILEYAQANDITWREDSSNATDNYGRNFLRHHIVPKMQKLNPNFLHTAERNLSRLQDTKENLDFLTREFLGLENEAGAEGQEAYSIDKQKLAQLPAPRQVLHDLLKPLGFTEEQARQLAEKLDRVGFLLRSSSGWQVLCDRTQLFIRPPGTPGSQESTSDPESVIIAPGELMLRIPGGGSLFFTASEQIAPYPDGTIAILVNPTKIFYPLTLRHWSEGDAFQPFGMDGQRQKLQDFFINQKLSRPEKDQVWLLVNGDGAIIWVLGLRLDERFKVQKSEEQVLKITWIH